MNLPPTFSIPTCNAIEEPSQKIKPRTHTRIIPSYQHISCNGGITKKKRSPSSFHLSTLHYIKIHTAPPANKANIKIVKIAAPALSAVVISL